MMFTSTILAITLLLGGAIAAPTEVPTETQQLERRSTCGMDEYCADCYPDNCPDESVTIGLRPQSINIGNADWGAIAGTIATSCYVNSDTGVGSCDPVAANVTTTLGNGDSGLVQVYLTSQSFPGWAKNLLVAAMQATLKGSAVFNSGSDSGQTPNSGDQPEGGVLTATVPSSYSLALAGQDTETITVGLYVLDTQPPPMNPCTDILSIGGAIAGAIPEVGAAAGIAFSIASLFCDS